MMSNNKILTVSYGTFSCTLEGFDDSFGTMKAIAEYFRDLASDDRYFGAEPPQPDAEMLTRIAEREISRRVEARQHEGRIVLSASDSDATPAQAPPAAAMAAVPAAAAAVATAAQADAAEAPEADQKVEDVAEDTAAPQEAAQVEKAAPADEVEEVTTDASDEVEEAAKAVEEAPEADEAPAKAEAEAEPVAEGTEADTTDEDADDLIVEHLASDAEELTANEDLAEEEADSAEDTQEDAKAVEAEAGDDAEATAEPVVAPAPAAVDSIAAKLQRIRAVVSHSQQSSQDSDMFEDEHADDLSAQNAAPLMQDDEDDSDENDDSILAAVSRTAASNALHDAARDIEDAQEVDDAVQAAAEDADDAQDDDDIASILARFEDDDSDDDVEAEAEAEENTDLAQPALARQDVETAEDDDDDLGLDTLAALMAQEDDAQDDAEDDADNLFESGEDTAAPAAKPRQARVIKVKRADIEAALAKGDLEEVDEDDDDDDDIDMDTLGPSSLSEQEEAELLAELAEVEAEAPAGDTAPEETARETAQPALVTAAPESAKESKKPVVDADVSRLMAEADNQMDEPEASSRRDAFAHLKAAVKAKKADADIGNDSIKDEGAFRSDLASVVKPRRPEAAPTRSQRPDGPRPAPLKLVAAQRVDRAEAVAPEAPVRPRRVSKIEPAAAAATSGNGPSFADYVEDMGAHNLPAVLEAAASYLAFVEGHDNFSRPQLMNTVRLAETEGFSREDGLRSFGQLLRTGKIEKRKGGRFAVTSDIGYRPDQRAAG